MNKSHSGFTLIEIMVALAILGISFGAILASQNGSINASVRAKRITTVSMLAQNIMVTSELELEGKDFEAVKEESTGEFEAPYKEYKWSRKINEVKFPNIAGDDLANPETNEGEKKLESDQNASNDVVQRINKLATNFLSDSTKEIVITIEWTEKNQKQTYTLSQYWVSLTKPFRATE